MVTSPWSDSAVVDSISPLTEANLIDALLASGSIPFVLEGVNNILDQGLDVIGMEDLGLPL